MRIRAFLALVLLLGLSLPGANVRTATAAASPPDFSIPGGHFYTQASGSPDPALGFAISDTNGILFWSQYRSLGSVEHLGYPSSQRFTLDGFVSQATQKSILQWRPQDSSVAFVNVLDLLHDQGLDEWLVVAKQIPPPFDTSPDQGLTQEQVVQRHLAILDISTAIKSRYMAGADPISLYGLPMSSADMGAVVVVRTQRAAFQAWKTDVPWAKAGDVTIANGGDIAKEAGLIPATAAAPEQAPAAATLAPLELFTQARPAIVLVSLPGVEGSGIIFDPRGYVVTNNHVIESGGPVTVSTLQGDLPASVVGADPFSDLAVLKVNGGEFPMLPFGDSDILALGEEVVAIGFSPLLPNPPNEVTATVLSLVASPVPSSSHRADFVQTNAALHPGDSGGPLLNLFGEVIGINTAIIFPRGRNRQFIASSIAINRAKPILAEIIARGKVSRPDIGVTLHINVPGIAGGNLPAGQGLLVINVAPGSPAAQAGLEFGDVITAIDGSPVNFPSDFQQALAGAKIGDKMTLTVVGQDETARNVQVTLAESP